MHFFETEILHFFKSSGRKHLPWRKKGISAYEVWVSEIMLQQTQVSRVIDYYKKFLEKYPSIIHLAQSHWEEFLPYYAGLGYYRRGENMLKTAKILVEEYGGEFPQDKKLLKKLPGIGEYTASAIMSFAYNDNHLAFDTNLQKVFGRYFEGNKRAHIEVEKLEKALESNTRDFNAAVMDFSNAICLKKPKCEVCLLSKKCKYFQTQGSLEEVIVKEKEKFPVKDSQVFLFLHKNHKEYYSPNPDTFEVFRLTAENNNRQSIKEYFRKHYQLELAVRPPHKKLFIQEKPTLFVNAQILKGEHEFGIFSQEEMQRAMQSLIS